MKTADQTEENQPQTTHSNQEPCPNCYKRPKLCVCSALVNIPTETKILLLQHPQEPKEDLGSARIANLCLPNSELKVGLSWRNLAAAMANSPAQKTTLENSNLNQRKWGVLFLGTMKGSRPHSGKQSPVTVLSPKGKPLQASADNPTPEKLEGIVVLDGTWRQAKAMWWRNPWLLKLNRIILTPQRPSLYGNLRKEPRKESLSTLESIALCLATLEGKPEIEEEMLKPFRLLLEKCSKRNGR